jgi:YfiH family protein
VKLFDFYQDKLFYKISSRYGGVSDTPYDSLNLALHVGDNPKDVLENRTILSKNSNFYLDNLIYMDQTHGDNIEIIKDSSINRIQNCDALITNVKNIPIMVMVADCIPIMIFDPVKEIVAVVHAGRNGTFKEIVKKTILKMQSNVDDILVYMGASIDQCCYEIGNELSEIVIKSFGQKYIKEGFLDLKQMNYDQVTSIGVKEKNIEISPICTCCNKDYFSYRREGKTGRFAGLMMLR